MSVNSIPIHATRDAFFAELMRTTLFDICMLLVDTDSYVYVFLPNQTQNRNGIVQSGK